MEKSVKIVLPCYNEEKDLPKSIKKLCSYLSKTKFPYDWKICIADNGSTDSTLTIAKKISKKNPKVFYEHIKKKGRGRALKQIWSKSKEDIVCYMDIDLSTDLKHFRPLIDAIAVKGYDVAIGSRLDKKSRTTRGFKRDMLSKGYNILIKIILGTKFSDAQCGFKAVNRKIAKSIVPKIKDKNWFFDTELLVLAEKKNFRIFEIPVKWTDDPDSKVKVFNTVSEYIRDLLRLRIAFWKGKV